MVVFRTEINEKKKKKKNFFFFFFSGNLNQEIY
jgi:hypothetical protein